MNVRSLMYIVIALCWIHKPLRGDQVVRLTEGEQLLITIEKEPSWKDNLVALTASSFMGYWIGQCAKEYDYAGYKDANYAILPFTLTIFGATLMTQDPGVGYRQMSFEESWFRAQWLHMRSVSLGFIAGLLVDHNALVRILDRSSPLSVQAGFACCLAASGALFSYLSSYVPQKRGARR